MDRIGRRTFLKGAATIAGSAIASRYAFAQSPTTDDRITLGVPVTHSDWMLKDGIPWGPAGVKHMLDACKASGWSHIYWRVTDGGRAMYPSKVMRPGDKWDPDSFWSPQTDADRQLVDRFGMNPGQAKKDALLKKFEQMDYATFDAFGEAIRYGHSIGLRVHAWVTINEDDHGWGLVSDFARAHPDFRWVKRDGRPYRSQMSFAFPEVRDYKLSILSELLTNYDLDGLFLDWIRTGDVRDNPQTDPAGVADSGYEAPNVEGFKREYGLAPHTLPNDDDRWLRTRALPQTMFMRRVKALVAQRPVAATPRVARPSTSPAHIPIAVLVAHPWHYRGLGDKIDGNLRGLLLDLPTWAREGLMDAAIPAGYYRDGGNAEKAGQALKDETESKIPIWTFGWVPTSIPQFDADYRTARKLGSPQLLLWEGDYIDDRPNKAELQQAMRAKAKTV